MQFIATKSRFWRALQINNALDYREHYQPTRCATCHRLITDQEELEFMADNGECGMCDHVKGEQFDN